MAMTVPVNQEADPTAQPNGAELVIQALEARGVEVIFGIPGVHTLAIYDALYNSRIRHVLARHEQGIGFMADGYARATGSPGVALVITGAGVTNIATPIAEAYTDSSPVLLLSSNSPRSMVDGMHGCLHDLKDQLGVTRAFTKWNERVTNPADVPLAMAQAFRQMAHGRPRPVAVEIPLDVLDERATNIPQVDLTEPGAIEPDAGAIRAAAEAIARSRRVVIYAGGGAVSAEAGDALVALAERLGAPVMTSIMGKGAIPEDHPLSLGALWSTGNAVDMLLGEADCLVVVGSKMGEQATEGFQMTYPSTVVRIDVDHQEMNRNLRPTAAVIGDALRSTEALLDQLEQMEVRLSSFPADRVRDVRAQAEASNWGASRRDYIDALRRAIPRDGILSSDMTMMAYVACGLYPVYEPRTWMHPSGYGTLGFALPVAIGAKVGRPDATVVAVVGDGGFQYTMGDLGCAVQERLPIPIVIFNDSTYSAVKNAQQQSREERYIGVDLENPDYVKLADAYGIPGVRANSPEELETAIIEAATGDRPTIIDVPIPGWV